MDYSRQFLLKKVKNCDIIYKVRHMGMCQVEIAI